MQEQLKDLGAAGVIAYGVCSGLRVCEPPAVATGRGVVRTIKHAWHSAAEEGQQQQ